MNRLIKVLHIESTDVCNLACPLCSRETDVNFNKSVQHHLTVEQVYSVLGTEFISNLDKMFMCGNYGDPAAGQHTVKLYEYFRSINPTITLGMNTNGSLRTTNYWQELGEYVLNQPRDYVVFSIDGLEDTNANYRRGVDWHKLMSNVDAYISAGGSAHWDMLVYQHNQHQVEECEQLARNMGFSWFRAKVSRRVLSNSNLQTPTGWQMPVTGKGPIQCHVLKEKSAYIDAQGRLSPCCWLGGSQNNIITDIKQVQTTWKSSTPNSTCQSACGTTDLQTSFSSQWQKEVELV